jgi:hypothetical protein
MRDLALDLAAALDPVVFARNLGVDPDPWQARVLRSPSKRLILNCSRQAGKSTTTALRASHRAVYQPGSLVLCISPSQRQSGELYRKVQGYLRLVPGLELNEDTRTSLVLPNGSRVISLPGSEATVRGFSGVSLLLEDEASRVDDDLHFAIRPMLAASGGTMMLLSTPHGKVGHFFQAWTGPDAWERVEVKASECPRIDPAFLAEERRALGPVWFGQEYECQFADTINSLFRSQDIEAALRSDIEPLTFGSTEPTANNTALRSDVAPMKGIFQ